MWGLKSLDEVNDVSFPDDGGVEEHVEYSEECVQDTSLPECEAEHNSVEAEETGHSAAETGQRLARGCPVCGVRVGVVGYNAGQQEQARPQQ